MRFCAFIVSLLCFQNVYSQSVPAQNTAITLKRTIEINHIAPRAVDDAFSSDLFDLFFEMADPDHLYFTQQDLASFSRFRTLLDNELNKKGWTFLHAVLPVFKNRMQAADSLVQSTTAQAFDFTVDDFLPADFKNKRAANDAEWKKRWQLQLKKEVWEGLVNQRVTDRVGDNMDVKKVFAQEPRFRNRLRERYRSQFAQLLQQDAAGLVAKMEQAFYTALSHCFDPHTDYFNPASKSRFTSALDTEGYYFGFSLGDNEKGEVVIRQLIPGGPAWKSGLLNQDDVFQQLQWEGADPVDVSNATAHEINQLINDQGSKKLSITVRKANAAVVTVTLQRERMENEAEFVKSFVLSGARKIGYIYLPSFYTSWELSMGSSCAEDMAKEIVKLKKEGIEGLILDVRFNGGGSLQEAIELTGIFIDEGPLGQFKNNLGKVISLKDVNRGTVWDGPLLLMVNGQSASASEMIAAALQDYNRAVIAGSTTYGKATAQQFIALDTFSKASENRGTPKDEGYLKITNGRLYRVTGKTAQATGVQPDILLPDLYSGYSQYEHQMPFHIRPDSVKKNNYYQPLAPINMAAIKAASAVRVAAHVKFRILKTLSEKNAGGYSTVLTMVGLQQKMAQGTELKKMQQLMKQPAAAFKAGNHSFDQPTSDFEKEANQRWLERLASDPYVEECYLIITDLINLTTKKEL